MNKKATRREKYECRDEFESEVLSVFAPDPAFDAKRTRANAVLLQLLTRYLESHPTERFCQALRNLGVVTESTNPGFPPMWHNEFMTEPAETLKRVRRGTRTALAARAGG